MFIKKFAKKSSIALLALVSSSLFANEQGANGEVWHNLSDPLAVYSNVSVGGGSEGVDVSASYGGYLNGQYKHKMTVEAMNDLDYYNVNYMLLNAGTNSGFTVETSWGRDLWDLTDVNNSSVGVFAKIPLMENKLTIYPKLNLGMLWGEDVDTTTYIQFDVTTRYKINHIFWVGITPTYTYAMKGYDIKEWDATLDVGAQLSGAFAVGAHWNDDNEFWFDVVFAF
jgi:hypothetical protein